MNVENGTEAGQFPKKEYINGIFVAVQAGSIWTHEPLIHKQKETQREEMKVL